MLRLLHSTLVRLRHLTRQTMSTGQGGDSGSYPCLHCPAPSPRKVDVPFTWERLSLLNTSRQRGLQIARGRGGHRKSSEAADQNVPQNLNAFVLKKAIDGMAKAELDNVKPMKSGRVFIEVETKQQCKNLLKTTKLLGYLPVKVSPHRTLHLSKFVIKCEELDTMEEDEIKKELQPQGIIAVKRISIRYSLYVLTIKGQNIPKKNKQYWIPEKRNTTIHSQPSKMFSMPEIWTYQEFV